MITQKMRILLPGACILATGIILGLAVAPKTSTVTVEKPVEKIVEKIVYVPQPVQPQAQPKQIPFNMDEGSAFRYRQSPDVVTTYVVINDDNHYSPKSYIESTWPNFGQIVNEERVGEAVNNHSAQIFRMTVKKYDCWKW